ncbi:polypeptide N-acetylgalactosaminyltransferase 1 [Eurytemora carolleeae]|uniref:polypeptide N-acetylgalactosaminyltransferase 1 n=1 Tax=Eurytemora carolleeae TaxID=1294199 RepID=UPI000C78F398|nr:polypeptide N-acetylgalactosaminyltransferase 1 [Eurytemora carolleeae]|eukprot:XP_023346877.1 polypeptide N-acetylgalactosaminyltransferase 1-like [Eurytemora affinis]
MGRGVDSKLGGKMLRDIISAFGRRQVSLIFFRYKYMVLILSCVLFLWACLGDSTSSVKSVHPVHQALEELEPEYPDFEEKTEKEINNRNIKETVHKTVHKTVHRKKKDPSLLREKILSSKVEDEERSKLLVIPSDSESKIHNQDLDKQYQKPVSPRRRENTLNGVMMRNQDPVDVEWVVVGGADIYKAQDVGGRGGYDEFLQDFAKQVEGAGEGGEPVHLSGVEKQQGEEILKKEAFNLVASDKIIYTRSVPDTRDRRCQAVHYDANLPTASIVIIFTNEAWSPLIRTIYSVLNRSPAEFIHEIILVDDFSDKKHLGSKLERFIRKYFPSKVKLLRLKERQGLIRARLTGARAATGDVLIFLDSHCECNTGWLEPLLQRIKEEPMAFVVPIIDVIDDKTMEYYHGNGNYFQVGGFTWGGHFTWIDISPEELARRGSPIAPTRSPTMAGGLFAVSRKTFWDLGSYDEEMDVWGGENLEMSFRVWQCGGVLETIPCSRVGHIFRSFHPYSFPGNKDTHGINTARTVEVWMDEYKKLFYMHRPDLLSTDIGSVKNRNKFREDKQCKPFSWFLKNIYHQKFILDDPEHVYAYGRLRNPNTDTCLDNLQNDDKDR